MKKITYFVIILCLCSPAFGQDFGNCPDGTNYAQSKPCQNPAVNPYLPFEDSFEGGLSHWSQRKGRERGAGGFETTSKYAHTGTYSATTSSPDHMIAYDPEDILSDKYFECWFYDDMAKDHASLCGVLYETANYMDSIMAGTETYISPNKYTYHVCYASKCENFAAEIPRSSGWHQVKIVNKGKENTIYIDGTEVFRTDKVPDWRYVFAKVNDWDHEQLPVAYFDDLKVDFLRGTLPLQSARENTNTDMTPDSVVENPPVESTQNDASHENERLDAIQQKIDQLLVSSEKTSNKNAEPYNPPPLNSQAKGNNNLLYFIMISIVLVVLFAFILIKTNMFAGGRKDSRYEIEILEKRMRKLVHKVLTNAVGKDYLKAVDPKIQEKLEERIKGELKKHPYKSQRDYHSIERRLEFCDIRNYSEIITSEQNWQYFKPIFQSKPTLEKKFEQLIEFRNKLMHARQDDETSQVTDREGEAAVIWFSKILDVNKV